MTSTLKVSALASSLASVVVVALTACTQHAAPPVPGSARDAHGCIPSAGYAWCTRTAQCERPWELAAQKRFTSGQQEFEAFCAGSGP